MLKELGVFWMNYGDIIIAISAAITLIGVVFTLFKNNSISTRAVDRTSEAEKSLSSEHKGLSAENKGLSVEHQIILERTADSKAMLQRLLIAEASKTVQFATLNDAQKTLSASAENIGKFATEFSRLAYENAMLTRENQTLRQQLEAYRFNQEERHGDEPEWGEFEQ